MKTKVVARSKQIDRELALNSRTYASRIRNPKSTCTYLVPVLGKAITIIRLLEEAKEALNVSEISEQTGVSKSTTYRILRTLSAYGYIPQGTWGVYSLREDRLFGSPVKSQDRKKHLPR